MISFKQGKVQKILSKRPGITRVQVDLESDSARAINYDDLTGDIKEGDRIILNTTAVELGLGTGGVHYVLWNMRHKNLDSTGPGHIMKLRYTPMQVKCLAVEEADNQFHERMSGSCDLKGMPVVAGSLHSQLPAVVTSIKQLNPKLRVAYIMTDGGALPIVFSNLVGSLKSLSLIDATITCGHAFGGDFEAVNVFSALTAAKEVVKADIAVVIMGPGIVGTKTTLGFSGIEQGQVLNAVGALKGKPIAIVRLHFADQRKRHYGVSHHTLTTLSLATLTRSTVVIPDMSGKKREMVLKQLKEAGILSKHNVVAVEDNITLEALKKLNIDVTTMGRKPDQEEDFFRAAGAAGMHAVKQLERNRA